MEEFTNSAELANIIIHQVGNKLNEEGVLCSENELGIKEDVELLDVLKNYFLTAFKSEELFHLNHETSLELNEIFHFAQKIFSNPDSFVENSKGIAKHLYNASMHHKIKGGELYVVYFKNCPIDNSYEDAIGLFKSENKDTFLKVFPKEKDFDVTYEKGINIHKLDKGCLIFNVDEEKGYRLKVVDQTNKSDEARYWREQFLNVIFRSDSFQYTQNYLSMYKKFVTEVMPEEFEVEKADQIDMLNKSMDFFKKNESFEITDFAQEVMPQPELLASFQNFKTNFAEEQKVPIVDEFHISNQAVKKQAKVYKSVLKLDKNFHIYIHGNKELIEKGFDEEKGMNYYKVYFTQEV